MYYTWMVWVTARCPLCSDCKNFFPLPGDHISSSDVKESHCTETWSHMFHDVFNSEFTSWSFDPITHHMKKKLMWFKIVNISQKITTPPKKMLSILYPDSCHLQRLGGQQSFSKTATHICWATQPGVWIRGAAGKLDWTKRLGFSRKIRNKVGPSSFSNAENKWMFPKIVVPPKSSI